MNVNESCACHFEVEQHNLHVFWSFIQCISYSHEKSFRREWTNVSRFLSVSFRYIFRTNIFYNFVKHHLIQKFRCTMFNLKSIYSTCDKSQIAQAIRDLATRMYRSNKKWHNILGLLGISNGGLHHGIQKMKTGFSS